MTLPALACPFLTNMTDITTTLAKLRANLSSSNNHLSQLTLEATQSLRQEMEDIEYRCSNDTITLGLVFLLILAVFIAIDQMTKRDINVLREEIQSRSVQKREDDSDGDVRAEIEELRDD